MTGVFTGEQSDWALLTLQEVRGTQHRSGGGHPAGVASIWGVTHLPYYSSWDVSEYSPCNDLFFCLKSRVWCWSWRWFCHDAKLGSYQSGRLLWTMWLPCWHHCPLNFPFKSTPSSGCQKTIYLPNLKCSAHRRGDSEVYFPRSGGTEGLVMSYISIWLMYASYVHSIIIYDYLY